MRSGVTAQLLFDGTFSTDAVASVGHQRVQQLHDEAMATIASLAETWGRPAEEDAPAPAEAPLTYRDPATWSVVDDEDDRYGDDDVLLLPRVELPALLLRSRRAATGELAVPAERQYA